MIRLICIAFLLFSVAGFSQNDRQTRYTSGFRQFYMWNETKQNYELKDSEYESSVIDVREINFSNNGYICIAMVDDAMTRMYHGSITNFRNEGGDEVWSLRSKILKSRVVYNREKKTITYSYEANGDRYMKIFVFNLNDDTDFAVSNPR